MTPFNQIKMHNHGTQKVGAKMRAGLGEGLTVLNRDYDKVAYLYTDSVTSCVQVVLRNDMATFTCHLLQGKTHDDQVAYWVGWARNEFEKEYGAITFALLVCGDSETSNSHSEARKGLFGLNVAPTMNCGGVAIEIRTGAIIKYDGRWNTGQADVIGYQTARELIHVHFTGKRTIGPTWYGDYYDHCPACN